MRVKLSRTARTLLARRGRLTVRVTLTLTDPAGRHRKLSRTLRLVRRRG